MVIVIIYMEKIYKFNIATEPFNSDRLIDGYDCCYTIISTVILLILGRCLAEYYPIKSPSEDMMIYALGILMVIIDIFMFCKSIISKWNGVNS